MKNLVLRVFLLFTIVASITSAAIYYIDTKLQEESIYEGTKLMSQGTFNLLDNFLAKYPSSQWSAILDKYQPAGTKKIDLIPIDKLTLDKHKIAQLNNNKIVYVLDESNPYDYFVIYRKAGKSNLVYKSDFSPGTIFWLKYLWGWSVKFVSTSLKAMPESEWPSYLKLVSSQHGFPLSIVNADNEHLAKTQLDRLHNHEWIVEKYNASEGLFYVPIGNGNQALKFGPLRTPFVGEYEKYISFSISLIIFLVIIFIFALLFALTLEKLKKLADDYGNSNFDSNIKINKSSSLYPLYKNLTVMGKRIKTLIHSHKDLTNSISHELRTPISRLRFSLELMKDAHDSTEIHNRIASMEEDISELEVLVSEILSYSQLDRVGMHYEMHKINLLKLINSIITKIEFSNHSNKKIINNIDQSKDITILANEKYIQRALHNIIQNAVNHAKSQIRISIKQIDLNRYELIIEDDGYGIPPEERDNIFNPFVQLPQQPKDGNKGFGLGLAITKKILDQHQWKIQVDDSDLEGAKFTVTFS